jgi:hypothetical protein
VSCTWKLSIGHGADMPQVCRSHVGDAISSAGLICGWVLCKQLQQLQVPATDETEYAVLVR